MTRITTRITRTPGANRVKKSRLTAGISELDAAIMISAANTVLNKDDGRGVNDDPGRKHNCAQAMRTLDFLERAGLNGTGHANRVVPVTFGYTSARAVFDTLRTGTRYAIEAARIAGRWACAELAVDQSTNESPDPGGYDQLAKVTVESTLGAASLTDSFSRASDYLFQPGRSKVVDTLYEVTRA